jgi:D-lactate dehydrogenase
MKMAVFDSHKFDRTALEQVNAGSSHDLAFFEVTLTQQTVALARGFPAVCIFVHDKLDAPTLRALKQGGTSLVALRCAGFNNVDLAAAEREGIHVVRVPEYSPYSVAEHAMALLLSLDGLVGFDLHGKTIGIIGLGKIGSVFARIAHGFGCRLLGYDVRHNDRLTDELGLAYVSLEEIYVKSDVISLHVPLLPETGHLIQRATLEKMKPGVIIINTSRGALINAHDLVEALKSGRIAGAALDVYEEEEKFFFRDLSGQVLQDDILARLVSCPNVLITAHQAFLTREALQNISETTLGNLTAFAEGGLLTHELTFRPA